MASLLLLGFIGTSAAGQPPPLTVYAAADLAFPFKEIVPLFEKQSGSRVTLVLGSTGNLAKQIEHGAPADVFFAADVAFIEQLRDKGVIIPESRLMYAQGRLVLATSNKTGVRVTGLKDLSRPDVKRIAIANPDHAPYGRAAREALEAVGLWDPLRPKLVYGENIRHAMQFVETGAVDAGIVAQSVANVPDITSVVIDPSLHRPLNQMAVVVKRSTRPELGLAFLGFVNGPDGRAIMKRYGFRLAGEF